MNPNAVHNDSPGNSAWQQVQAQLAASKERR